MASTVYDWLKDGFVTIPSALFKYYNQLNLSSDEWVFIVFMLSKVSTGQLGEEPFIIANQLNWSQNHLYEVIESLLSKGYLAIELVTNDQGKKSDHYTLRPLFEKLDELYGYSESDTEEEVEEITAKELVNDFEQEFGRSLSPIELETLNNWVNEDKYDLGLIRIALREAVIHQAYSLNYIDKILLNWEKANIKTPKEAERHIKEFNERKQANKPAPKKNDERYADVVIPVYDFFNQDN